MTERRAGLVMRKELQNWAKEKSRRETNLAAKMERLRLPRLPPNAVVMKPRGQDAVNNDKLFRSEEEFLEVESSLASSCFDDEDRMDVQIPPLFHSQTERKIQLHDSVSLPDIISDDPAAARSSFFFLSQLNDGESRSR